MADAPQKIDPRLVRVGIEVNGKLRQYENLDITATGSKFANPLQDECEVTISNLEKTVRNAILTEVSPFNQNRTAKRLIVDAGRVSTGYKRIYTGDIVTCSVTQPPDIQLKLQGLVGDFQKGKFVAAYQQGPASLKQIAQGTANTLGVDLNFQASDKTVANYSFSGAAAKQLGILQDIGGVNAYIDNGVLIVKDFNVPLNGKLRKLDLDSGLIGIPEVTTDGIKVTMLLDGETACGGGLEISSKLNPSLNGTYVIFKLGFNITSRDTPFYWIAEAKRLNR